MSPTRRPGGDAFEPPGRRGRAHGICVPRGSHLQAVGGAHGHCVHSPADVACVKYAARLARRTTVLQRCTVRYARLVDANDAKSAAVWETVASKARYLESLLGAETICPDVLGADLDDAAYADTPLLVKSVVRDVNRDVRSYNSRVACVEIARQVLAGEGENAYLAQGGWKTIRGAATYLDRSIIRLAGPSSPSP
jgi:hypothetical protein